MGKGGKGPPPHVRAFRSQARGGGMFTDGTVDLDGLHRLLNDPAVNGSGPRRGVDLDQCAGGVDGFASVIGSSQYLNSAQALLASVMSMSVMGTWVETWPPLTPTCLGLRSES